MKSYTINQIKKLPVKKELEDKIYRYVVGIIGQFGRPISELSELQQADLKAQTEQLTRVCIHEAGHQLLKELKGEGK